MTGILLNFGVNSNKRMNKISQSDSPYSDTFSTEEINKAKMTFFQKFGQKKHGSCLTHTQKFGNQGRKLFQAFEKKSN